MAMKPQESEEVLALVLKILHEERDANKDDPLIVSLITRIENRIAELLQGLTVED